MFEVVHHLNHIPSRKDRFEEIDIVLHPEDKSLSGVNAALCGPGHDSIVEKSRAKRKTLRVRIFDLPRRV